MMALWSLLLALALRVQYQQQHRIHNTMSSCFHLQLSIRMLPQRSLA
jgi:hypothetical protein